MNGDSALEKWFSFQILLGLALNLNNLLFQCTKIGQIQDKICFLYLLGEAGHLKKVRSMNLATQKAAEWSLRVCGMWSRVPRRARPASTFTNAYRREALQVYGVRQSFRRFQRPRNA